jgi:dihydroxy-acid dehydratase
MSQPLGLDGGLTNYGDRDLRRSFTRSMGMSTELFNKPVVGIAISPSGFNNCHRHTLLTPGMTDNVRSKAFLRASAGK